MSAFHVTKRRRIILAGIYLEELYRKNIYLEEENELSPDMYLTKAGVSEALWELYADAELHWLLEGDQNTSYFYRVENGRKRKKIPC